MGPLTFVSGVGYESIQFGENELRASMGPLTFVSGVLHEPRVERDELRASMGPLTFVSGVPGPRRAR